MKIEEIYTDLANALSNIELYRKLSKDIMQQEYERLSERAKMASERGEEYPFFESAQAMYFYDAMTGTAVAYGHSELSAEDKLRLIETQKNRQYCWLGRVAAGSYPPAAPTDPGVPNSGTRLLR